MSARFSSHRSYRQLPCDRAAPRGPASFPQGSAPDAAGTPQRGRWAHDVCIRFARRIAGMARNVAQRCAIHVPWPRRTVVIHAPPQAPGAANTAIQEALSNLVAQSVDRVWRLPGGSRADLVAMAANLGRNCDLEQGKLFLQACGRETASIGVGAAVRLARGVIERNPHLAAETHVLLAAMESEFDHRRRNSHEAVAARVQAEEFEGLQWVLQQRANIIQWHPELSVARDIFLWKMTAYCFAEGLQNDTTAMDQLLADVESAAGDKDGARSLICIEIEGAVANIARLEPAGGASVTNSAALEKLGISALQWAARIGDPQAQAHRARGLVNVLMRVNTRMVAPASSELSALATQFFTDPAARREGVNWALLGWCNHGDENHNAPVWKNRAAEVTLWIDPDGTHLQATADCPWLQEEREKVKEARPAAVSAAPEGTTA